MQISNRKSILITGASSGIGYALAKEFASRDYDLALAARRVDSLDALRAEITGSHPACKVHTYSLDVTRCDDVFATTEAAATRLGKLDIVIANAGIGSLGRVGEGHFEGHRQIIETNVVGAMATCDAAVKQFKRQGFGHLSVISSVAAFIGLPGSSAYSASKAAIATYAAAIRAETYGTKLSVSTIYPGYIDTPINQSNPSRPFLITVERGARIIANKIESGVQTAIVPAFPWALLARIVGFIPVAALARAARTR